MNRRRFRDLRRPGRAGVLALCLLSVLGLSGCGEATDAEKKLRAALHNTEALAHRFVYSETFTAEKSERKTAVQGLIEDDLRYKARVAIDGAPVLDETVSDDALAVRFLDPSKLADFVRKPKKQDRGGTGVGADGADAPASPTPVGRDDDGPDPVVALQTRRWVLDQAGAPAVFGGAEQDRLVGEDPVLDALDVFGYVERAMDEAVRIVEFNEESLEYRKSEDPFDTPKEGSGVIRYDLVAPKLPKAADTTAGGNQVTPDMRHFRKMSVYVKDERVVQIREKIDVESRLDGIARLYETEFPEDYGKAEVAVIAVEALNVIRTGQGEDPIRLRSMSYKLAGLGREVKVEMPTEVVLTSLAVLQNRGRPADEAAGAALAAGVAAPPTAPAEAPPAPTG